MSIKSKKIYVSSAGWMVGPLVQTKYNSSCLRWIWAVAHGNIPRIVSINPASQGLGALSEEALAAQFRRRRLKQAREVPFRQEFKGVTISGRIDFEVETKDGIRIWENKASTSTHVLKDVIEGGKPDPNYMAQLVSYLAFRKVSKGYLNVNFYQLGENQKDWICSHTRTFEVEILDSGEIRVDGEGYERSVRDLSRWYAEAAKVLTDPLTIPTEPRMDPIPYKNPCYFCPLKSVCAKHKDSALSTEQFLRDAVEAGSQPQKPRDFNFSTVKKGQE